jgi:hypothetical protein
VTKFTAAFILVIAAHMASACDLCAIYGADNARGQSTPGFLFSISEQ